MSLLNQINNLLMAFSWDEKRLIIICLLGLIMALSGRFKLLLFFLGLAFLIEANFFFVQFYRLNYLSAQLTFVFMGTSVLLAFFMLYRLLGRI